MIAVTALAAALGVLATGMLVYSIATLASVRLEAVAADEHKDRVGKRLFVGAVAVAALATFLGVIASGH